MPNFTVSQAVDDLLRSADDAALRDGLGAVGGIWPEVLGGTGKDALPYVHVTKAGHQVISTATWTAVSGWTEVSDTNNCWSGDEFTSPDDRRWDLRVTFAHDNPGANAMNVSFWKWNGSAFAEYRRVSAMVGTAFSAGSAVIDLVTGDRIKVYVLQASGGNINLYEDPVISNLTITTALA